MTNGAPDTQTKDAEKGVEPIFCLTRTGVPGLGVEPIFQPNPKNRFDPTIFSLPFRINRFDPINREPSNQAGTLDEARL